VLLRIGIGWHFLREGWVKFTHPSTFTAAPYLVNSWGPLAPVFKKIATLTWAQTPVVNWFLDKDPSKMPAWANIPWMLRCSDLSMPWLLMISGLGLILGLLTRTSIVIAMCLLVMFYAATPPFDFAPVAPTYYAPGQAPADALLTPTDFASFKSSVDHAQWASKHMINHEGNYLLVNKNLVEFLALAALLSLDTGLMGGLDVYLRPICAAICGLFRRKEKTPKPVAPEAQAVQS